MKKKSIRRRKRGHNKPARRRRSMSSNGMAGGLKGAAINTAKGAVGGILYSVIAKMVDKDGSKVNNRIIAGAVLAFGSSMFLKQPAIGAGVAGAFGLTLAQKLGFLNDGEDYSYVPESLLSERQPLVNASVPNMDYYGLQEPNMNLYDGNFDRIYPGYLNPGFYDNGNNGQFNY